MNSKKRGPGDAWGRSQLTIRLTAVRKERLRLLAKREGLCGGPGAAIDRAIELALAEPSNEDVQPLSAIEELIDAAERERQVDAAASRAALAQVAAELAKLRALLAALAEGE